MSVTDDNFVVFDGDRVSQLVGTTDALSAVVGDGPYTSTEVGDGNLNQVFIVTGPAEGGSGGVVVKQALPYLRVAGEGWPLTRERMRFETQSLLLYNQITPSLAPTVYAHDHDQSWVAMEYLAAHTTLRHSIIAGDPLGTVAADIGEFCAALAYETSEMSLDAPTKRARAIEYLNPALCHLQEEFVYTNPFFDSPENQWNPAIDAKVRELRADREVKLAIARAKADYMGHGQALLHGDLHTGSVMVTRDGDDRSTNVIDPEFAFYGPIAYDIGTFLAHLAIAVAAHEALTDDAARRVDVQRDLIGGMRTMWGAFVAGIERRWTPASSGDLAVPAYWGDDREGFTQFRHDYVLRIAADLGRHGGSELLRRCMGIVAVAELEAIEDPASRGAVETKVIELARMWLVDADSPRVDRLGDAVEHLIAPLETLLANPGDNR